MAQEYGTFQSEETQSFAIKIAKNMKFQNSFLKKLTKYNHINQQH
jgi:hypothetical protein